MPDAATRAVAIDPRIKARRIAVQRDAGRRRLRYVIAGGSVVAVVAAAFGALHTPLADVDAVSITGTAHTEPDAVLAAAGLDDRPQLIDVDPGAAARRIEALPWVADATVIRHWPGEVEVVVAERVAVAVAPVDPAGATWALVDGSGRVLEHRPGRPPKLPALSKGPVPGAPGTTLDPVARAALAVSAALGPELAARTGDVVILPDDEVELALLPQGRVRLGRPDDLGATIEALATVLARVDLDGIAVIDLRVPSAPAITRA